MNSTKTQRVDFVVGYLKNHIVFSALSLPVPGCCFAQSLWRTLRIRITFT
jgi:hypothetical protein